MLTRSCVTEFIGGSLKHLWIYLVGPLAGGALAAYVFGLQNAIHISIASPPKPPVPEVAAVH